MALKFALFTGGILSLNRRSESLHTWSNLRSSTKWQDSGALLHSVTCGCITEKPWRMRWRKGQKKVDGGAKVITQACARNNAAEIFAKAGGEAQNAPVAAPHRSWRITVDILVRQRFGNMSARWYPGPNRRTVGIRRAIRQARRRVQFYRNGRRPRGRPSPRHGLRLLASLGW